MCQTMGVTPSGTLRLQADLPRYLLCLFLIPFNGNNVCLSGLAYVRVLSSRFNFDQELQKR